MSISSPRESKPDSNVVTTGKNESEFRHRPCAEPHQSREHDHHGNRGNLELKTAMGHTARVTEMGLRRLRIPPVHPCDIESVPYLYHLKRDTNSSSAFSFIGEIRV